MRASEKLLRLVEKALGGTRGTASAHRGPQVTKVTAAFFQRMNRIVREKLESKDLRAAIERASELWSKVTPTEHTKVNLHVLTSHAGAMKQIAQLFPNDCRGFSRLGSNANSTATEILCAIDQPDSPKWWTVDVELCSALGPNRVTQTLSFLRNLAPGALRQSSISVDVDKVRWPGAPERSVAGFTLDDAKALRRKVRFEVRARLEWEEADRAEAQRALAAVRLATGLDFSRGKLLAQPLQTPSSSLLQSAAASVLFDHCLESVSRQLRAQGFDWKSLAGSFPDGEGVAQRFSTYGEAPPEKFRWEAEVSRWMKERLPNFTKVSDWVVDALTFKCPLQDEYSIVLVFDKHPGVRIGRVFKLRCGIAVDDSSTCFVRTGPALRCAGGHYTRYGDNCPEFSFNSLEDLKLILTDLEAFLTRLLPLLRSQLETCFFPGLNDLGSAVPIHGALTCQDALNLGYEHLRMHGISPGVLFRASLTGCDGSLRYREDAGAQCPVNGRLTVQHAWEFSFDQGDHGLILTVPFAGHLRTGRIWSRFWNTAPHSREPIPSDTRIDSVATATEAWRVRAFLAPRYSGMISLVGMIQLSGEKWTVLIEFSSRKEKSPGWVITTTEIEARTGRATVVHFDERFGDRARMCEQHSETL